MKQMRDSPVSLQLTAKCSKIKTVLVGRGAKWQLSYHLEV